MHFLFQFYLRVNFAQRMEAKPTLNEILVSVNKVCLTSRKSQTGADKKGQAVVCLLIQSLALKCLPRKTSRNVGQDCYTYDKWKAKMV